MIRIVMAQPNGNAVETEIDETIEAMQAIVGGYVQMIRPPSLRGLDLYCNEDGLGRGLPFNRTIDGHDLVGAIFVSGDDGEGEMRALTDDEAKLVLGVLNASRPS